MEADEQGRAGGPRQEAAAARQVLTISPPSHFSLELDADQAAAAAVDGAACVVAGAGSGKTRALLGRLRHLVHAGVAPQEIVLCTFTQRAAAQMVQQAARQLGSTAAGSTVEIGTLHQLAYRLLKRHGAAIGLSRFSVLAAADSLALLQRCLSTVKAPPSPTQLLAAHHHALVAEVPLADAIAARRRRGQAWRGSAPVDELEAALDAFARHKAHAGMLDFDDLLYFGRHLLAEGGVPKMAHVLVDEYQDIDALQADVLRLLGGTVWAVGDPAQAIYGFRGASGALLSSLAQASRAVTLRNSYRALPELVALGNRVRARIDGLQLIAQRASSSRAAPVRVVSCADFDDEADLVALRVRRALVDGLLPRDIAVLYRSHRQRRRLAEALRAAELPVSDSDDGTDEAPRDGVTLCTVHQAKGLEWHMVLLTGLAEGTFPVGGDADIDEERRLFYVAVTRARDQLVLLHPVQSGGRAQVPSRFILELA